MRSEYLLNDDKLCRRNIKLTIAYDGTGYHGFQRQNNALSVQEVLENKLASLFGHSLKMAGAGRTDSGVHAYGQVVNFYTTGVIPADRIARASRGLLPDDIVINDAEDVAPDFHARYSAKSKIYIYRIYPHSVADPFLRNYAWHVAQTLDVALIHKAAQHIVGTHDFSAFRAAGSAPINPVRTIFEASCTLNAGIIEFTFWGNGFLYHMVRNLVGTLVNVGRSRLTEEQFINILASRDRKNAGATAPPQGLYLKQVFY
ncbi:tRNA pseudouridine(38-40) synthase TruA [Dendrosporobacter sp. 1207_IL3150]|uniref:tRNA pseudouridine(38-40) synthase TruA n=1 Tax=Dendrosporobacter sp. 1207_IL3150 TaxID=3084054 RepID=UPI002FDA3619